MTKFARFIKETQILRAVMENPNVNVFFTRHGREEMTQCQADELDVDCVLRKGEVTLVEWKKDELWRVEGKDVDGNRRLQVVIAVYEEEVEVKVVTVF